MQPIPIRARLGGLTLSNVWATAVVTVSVGVTFMFRMSSIDLAYHVRAGEAILATHGAPSIDAFTFSMLGRPWLDQQWGAQVLLALVYRAGGWTAMGLFHGALVGATFWFLWLACRARGASSRLSAALTLGGFAVCFYNAGMRPQTMAYPLFTGMLWILADRRAHPRRLWILPFVMVVWANVHGSFPLGLVLIGLSWAEDRRDRAVTKNATLAVGVIGLVATAVGPYGLGCVALRDRHLDERADPGTHPGMGGDDDPLARRRGLLHIGARDRRVPGAPGNEDPMAHPGLARGRSSSWVSARREVRCGGGSCSR